MTSDPANVRLPVTTGAASHSANRRARSIFRIHSSDALFMLPHSCCPGHTARRRIAGQRGTHREGGRTAVDFWPSVLAGRLLLPRSGLAGGHEPA